MQAEKNTEKNIGARRRLIALVEIMALAIIVKEIGFTNLIKKYCYQTKQKEKTIKYQLRFCNFIKTQLSEVFLLVIAI